MKTISRDRYGSPDVLDVIDAPKPTPGAGEVLIKLHAVSLNASDWEILTGKPLYGRIGGFFTPKHKILGSDIAGRIEEVGAGVTKFKPGDAVFGDLMFIFGGFAEYCRAPADKLTLIPDGVSFETASCLPQAACIALQGICDEGGVKTGDKILINGAGGSSGMFAIQLAKTAGAEVTGVDNAAKQDFMRAMGADHVIDYEKTDYTRTGQAYDQILDLAAYRSIFDYQRALKPSGTYFMVGGAMALIYQLAVLGPLIKKFTGKKLSLLIVEANKDLDRLVDLVRSGDLSLTIDRTYPLEMTADALRYFGGAQNYGKIVITFDGGD